MYMRFVVCKTLHGLQVRAASKNDVNHFSVCPIRAAAAALSLTITIGCINILYSRARVLCTPTSHRMSYTHAQYT